MSIKKYFEVAESIKALSGKTADEIASQVESVGYHEEDIIEEERFIPRVDFSKPENFARYGSAEEYYDQAIKRIYNEFPYDGSLRERLQWENESTYIDLYIYNNRYPRTNGYAIVSADGWGTQASITDGYGLPDDLEYIFVKGGPNANPNGMSPKSVNFTGSNYYEPSKNRGSNLEFDLASQGASIEFWLNKTEFVTASTEKEVLFDLWNGENSSSADYVRFTLELSGTADGTDPFLLTVFSGSTGFFQQPIAATTFTTSSVADSNWHHYAVTVKSASAGVTTRFYVDGNLNNETILGSAGIDDTDSSSLRAYIGALIAAPSGSSASAGAGKLSGSLDELRYWKTQRSSKEIGRFWFTQVGGGVNTDPTPFTTTEESANVDLGVYFKFNEGITGRTSTDSTVLDYSGRFSNGSWTGYTTNSRNTGSAIVLSNAAISEYQDPIIYSFHPAVVSLASELQTSGSAHDVNNNAAVYNSIPSWITEEDSEGEKNTKYLTQIISSYFDTLHLQIDSLNHLKDIQYPSGSDKPLPFAEKLLSSYGFVAPEIFLDTDVLEKLADRSEDKVYEKSLHDIKNIIYQNIYNNLNYIYKSKGTEKAFRNLIRCFGIDDELIKLNMYADNVQYELQSNRRNIIVGDKFANFNTAAGKSANVYNYTDTSNVNSVGFITSSVSLTGGYATTLEAEILFPLKQDESSIVYVDTNTISASLFGVHGTVDSGTDTTWATSDDVNFQVYAVRDELRSSNVRFVLTGTAGGHVPELVSSLYEDVYNNTRWNLSVRIRPDQFPLTGLVDGTNSDYVIELHGVQADAGVILEEFTVTGTISNPPAAFLTSSKRAYVGAHRTNFTGTVLQTSDVKVNACRYWLDYVEDDALRGHILDTENHGALQPHLYAYPFNPSASFGDITKLDTLVFNWEFLNNTGSDASGQFIVDDISSGSAAFTRFGDLGNILNKQYTARGDFFEASSTKAIDKDFVVSSRLNLPENIQSQDMVRVLGAEDQDVFTTESRPINYFFAFEKSMYQTISEEMINNFATMRDLHNLIGDPVERWRPEYKQMKFVRQKFFEKVGNDELDFDKFYEFYKWFDSSLSVMLGQLVPASADFSNNVRTVIENHVLERPKYQNKFPFLQRQGATDIEGSVDGSNASGDVDSSPDDFPAGASFFSNRALTKRQIGSSNYTQTKKWEFLHSPLPTESENKNLPWQRYKKETSNSDRAGILAAVESGYRRRLGSPVKFAAEGQTAVGGVARHQSNKPNFTFEATQPYGPTVTATNIPKNIMLSFDVDVEELIETPDVYYPTLKQRLGFGLNPSINRGDNDKLKFDGNMYAPFSLYSSSVTTGYNSKVVRDYKSGVTVTNLHNDFVNSTDTSLQGPFTEKFVGGRYYRHTEINDGTDTRESRAEGFRLALGLDPSSSNIPPGASGALGVIPPNYPFLDSPAGSAPLGWLPELPTAQRFRDETAKRPVNIKNILMTTASVGTRLSGTIVHNQIGNYQKNYQVVQTAGRTANDIYFREQTFSFAPNPETLATRGRFPLYYAFTPAVKATGQIAIKANPPSSSVQALEIPFLRNDGVVQNIAIFFTSAPAPTDFSGYPTIIVQRQGSAADTGTELASALSHSPFGTTFGGNATALGTGEIVSLTQGLGGTAGNTEITDDGSGNFDLTSFAGGTEAIPDTGEDNANTGGNLNYELPNRDGVNSNETVIVNRFAGCGYEVMSRGYMDPAHEELSVYNVLPYRNLSVRDYGLQGSASVDVTAGRTITVVDQIGKNRGLNQRASLHAGPFGSDAAYGSVPELTYVTTPSWHKTNRNRRRRIELSGATYITASVYDNLFVQHAIPRSTQQYSWVTASLAEGQIIYGNDRPSCFSASVLSQLIVSGTNYDDLTFVGLTTRGKDPISASTHNQGFPLSVANQAQAYSNFDYLGAPPFAPGTDYFNFITIMRNGPYGYPTWKQIRAGETKIGRKLRETNQIGYPVPPKRLFDYDLGEGPSVGLRPNSFRDFTESPVSLNSSPITFILEDNTEDSDASNNMVVTVPFRNEIDYFSHEELNNFYGLKSDVSRLKAYRTVLDYTLSSSLSTVVSYTESLYPSDINMFDDRVRRRTNYSITDIWDDDRTKRSDTYGGKENSQGLAIPSASTWPLDGHLNFASTSSVRIDDGAGELMNFYTSYSGSVAGASKINVGATYALRVAAGRAGSNDAYAGDALWEAGTQSGKKPYENYSTYAEKIALVGKDHSIVPEFRISELIETYVEDNEGDFLADIDNVFNLTGAAISDSSQTNFYKTYSNSDFLKYFSVVDEDLNGQRSGDLKIQRDKVSLRCNALLKFLPYKGFYPAERTLELATLLSQSYFTDKLNVETNDYRLASRIISQPLFAPGIMHNTIKSGIAVGNWILTNTSSAGSLPTPVYETGSVTVLPEGNIEFRRLLNVNTTTTDVARGWTAQKLPFEAIYKPSAYFNREYVTGSLLYDKFYELAAEAESPSIKNDHGPLSPDLRGTKLYEFAIDNFLCETVEFFNDRLTSIRSRREDEFASVVSGNVYQMKMKFYRPLTTGSITSDPEVDRAKFDMYTRVSAFGWPLAAGPSTNVARRSSGSFSHLTSPAYAGKGEVTFTYTAPSNGQPSLDQIFANTTLSFSRDETVAHIPSLLAPPDYDPTMQMDSCFNLLDFYTDVPDNTVTQKKRWLIQSKFETPVLNLAGVDFTTPPATTVSAGTSSADQISLRGLWHQYGSVPTASDAGFFVAIEDASGESLADVVGMPTNATFRVGSVKKQNLLEEAVVAVPFKTVNNRRKFFGINDSNAEYDNIKRNLEKYVFPPKFDFLTNDTVDPILMYAFEFSAKVTQQDIADMWQNLPPDINEKFEQKEVVIDDKQVLDLLINNSEDIQWMVFKVKKRAKKSFEKYRRSLVTEDTTAFEDTIGPYSYNWPYDYFSLVELVKIDETVQYASADVAGDDS
jgi:hypothetical protein